MCGCWEFVLYMVSVQVSPCAEYVLAATWYGSCASLSFVGSVCSVAVLCVALEFGAEVCARSR